MASDRPTFHEAWYRVARLRPRLLSTVKVYRQHFRGRLWYVLENVANNRFSRIRPEAYRFVALLDGKRDVEAAWRLCTEQLGDSAPTQGEAIQLLGQLYYSNLLYAELAPDSENLFRHYRSRIKREVQSFLSNLLFVRIPLIDPNRFLNRWVHVFGKVFSWPGLAVWLSVILTGLFYIAGNIGELIRQSSEVLAPDNLILLYLTFVVVKAFHEFSHAFACKKFGALNLSRGQVHTIGIMFLVFTPVPFVDASSAWTFRNKCQRALVGAAGIMAELFAASVAAIVWANTSTGTVHIIAYNVIFLASVSTLLFNGNPLLRFDAYYVLVDLIEIPNLSQRSRSYFYYLVKRYVWGVEKAHNPANTSGERAWFVCYGIASTAYRIFICIRILLFLNDKLPKELFFIVPLLALSALIAWVLVPTGKFIRYLATNQELSRKRHRAVATTLLGVALITATIGIIPFPDHDRIEGVVKPVEMAVVRAETAGFVEEFLPSGQTVSPQGPALLRAFNPDLKAEEKRALAELRALKAKYRLAKRKDPATAQIVQEQMKAMKEKIADIKERLASLLVEPQTGGTWIAPDIEKLSGAYIQRGDEIGIIAHREELRIRATANQTQAGLMVNEAHPKVELRIKGRPDKTWEGIIKHIFPAGGSVLPSKSLGYSAGGSMQTRVRDPRGITTSENFFEVRIEPAPGEPFPLVSGQRVVARVRFPSVPLAVKWWRSLRQLFQKRFKV